MPKIFFQSLLFRRVWYTQSLRTTTPSPFEIEQEGLKNLKRELMKSETDDNGNKIKLAQYLIRHTLINLLSAMSPEGTDEES